MAIEIFTPECSAVEAYLALRVDKTQAIIEDSRKCPDKSLHQHLKSCIVHNMNWLMRGTIGEQSVDPTNRIDFKDIWAIRGMFKRYDLDAGKPPIITDKEFAFTRLIEDRNIITMSDATLVDNITEIVDSINSQRGFVKLFGPCSHPLVKLLRYQVGQYVRATGTAPSSIADTVKPKRGGPTAAVKTEKGIILISLDAHKNVPHDAPHNYQEE